MKILFTYIGPISTDRDTCNNVERLNVLELIPLCIHKDIERFYIESLESLGLIERRGDKYQILDDMFYKDPNYYSTTFLHHMYQKRVDIAIVPSFLSLAKHLYYRDKKLLTLPNVANILLYYNKGVLSSFSINRMNIKYIIYIDDALSNLYSEKQFKYGYKKMYIIEAFDYIFHDIEIPTILFIKNFQKDLSDLIEEVMPISNKISLGIDIAFLREEINGFTLDIAMKKSFLLVAISKYNQISQFINIVEELEKLDKHITCIVALTENYFTRIPNIEEVVKVAIKFKETLEHYKIIE